MPLAPWTRTRCSLEGDRGSVQSGRKAITKGECDQDRERSPACSCWRHRPLVTGCGGDSSSPPAAPSPTTASINVTADTPIRMGATAQGTGTAVLSNGQNPPIPSGWQPDAPPVASVTLAGLVTGVANGSATIVVVSGGHDTHERHDIRRRATCDRRTESRESADARSTSASPLTGTAAVQAESRTVAGWCGLGPSNPPPDVSTAPSPITHVNVFEEASRSCRR